MNVSHGMFAVRRRTSHRALASLFVGVVGLAVLGAHPASAAADCGGADFLVVVLDGPPDREEHPWVASWPDDAPVHQITAGGGLPGLSVRPTPDTSFEVLAAWLSVQAGVADVRCPPEGFVPGAELTPFPVTIERPDSGGPTPGRGGGRGGDGAGGLESDTDPDGDVGGVVGGNDVPTLPATGPAGQLLWYGTALCLVGHGMVRGAGRRAESGADVSG